MTEGLAFDARNQPIEWHLLSGHTREMTERENIVTIRTDNFHSIVELAPRRIPDMAAKLLSTLEGKPDYFGMDIQVDEQTDYPLAYGKNPSEFLSMVRYATERGFIEHNATSPRRMVRLRAEGLAEIESRRRSNLDSEKAFVAMWFGDEMRPVYENLIAEGIRDVGYRPVRALHSGWGSR